MKLIKVAVACVNQTPFAWDENFAHLRMAIDHARAESATVLCLPELAITGYGCEDAFFMDGLQDTAFAQLDALAAETHGMVVIVGLPIFHEKALYNCAAVLADGAIVGFAAKQFLPGDGVHYEPRWFKPWPAGEIDMLERTLDDGTQRKFPIGDLVFEIGDVRFGCEICEDAWVANRPGIDLALRGVDIMCNPSASHFAFDKFAVRQRFVIEGSRAFGVAYLYANLMGNEAGRIIYDGGGLIASGGELLARGRRFSFHDVELATAVVDIDGNRARGKQARRLCAAPRCRGAAGLAPVRVAASPARGGTGAHAIVGRPRVAARGRVRPRRRARAVGLPPQVARAGLRDLAVGWRRFGRVRGARRAGRQARVRRARRRRRQAALAVVHAARRRDRSQEGSGRRGARVRVSTDRELGARDAARGRERSRRRSVPTST